MLPPKQRFKRSLDDRADTQQHVLCSVQEQPGQQQEEDDDFGHFVKPGPKLVKYSTSKIGGVANPRRPRIGPAYQAVIPDWVGPTQ